MSRRLSIAGLCIVVAFCGIGFAALRSASEWWAGGLVTTTLGTLLVATLCASRRSEPGRTFWLGFALFGWVYLSGTLWPWPNSQANGLLTSKLLDRLFPVVHPEPPPEPSPFDAPDSFQLYSPQGQPSPMTSASLFDRKLLERHFQQIGHAIFALITATIGGLVSLAVSDRRRLPIEPPLT